MKFLVWSAILYAGYCLMLFVLQRAMLFPRHMIPPAERPERTPPFLEKIGLQMPFGLVEAWYLPPPKDPGQAPCPLVIFAHGNAERIDFCLEELQPFTQWGIGVLLVEFPGYGRSQGRPSQAAITDTFTAAYDRVTRRPEVDPSRVILYGRSIGGGAVCALLERRPAAALILMSTFTGVRAFAKRYLAPPFLVRDPFDNLSAVRRYTGPVLVFHGEHDEIIPFKHGKALAAAAANGRFISYACGHNDCPPDVSLFWEDIKSFLESTGLASPAAPASVQE